MDYKLAKQLKDAGFPQNEEGQYVCGRNIGEAYAPTLSELIDACGNEFEGLERKYDDSLDDYYCCGKEYQWHCNYEICGPRDETWEECDSQGKTPEEAVAKLWIKVKKNG